MDHTKIKPIISSQLMNTQDVCDYLNISRQYPRTLMKTNKLTPIKHWPSCPIFWLPEVLEFEANRNAKRSKHTNLADNDTTHKTIQLLDALDINPDTIEAIHIYNDPRDAVLAGYYDIRHLDSLNHLKHLKGYTFIISLIDSPDIYSSGLMCGYKGAAPNKTIEWLNNLGINFNNLEESIYYNDIIHLYNINHEWHLLFDPISPVKQLDNLCLQRGMKIDHQLFLRNNNLILIPIYDDELIPFSYLNSSYIEALINFIPDITTAELYNSVQCEENGYFITNYSNCNYYPLILSNDNHRQVWLSPDNIELDNSNRIQLKTLLKASGINLIEHGQIQPVSLLNKFINYICRF